MARGTPEERTPLPGPVSNIASWNYPMSVQVHAELVQLLAGNAVVAKTPSQGGFHCLTLAHALMRREGLPVTLMSGVGEQLADALIRSEGIGALAFVGGRANGRKAAVSLVDTGRRHMLEQEGLNAWGIWDFTQWHLLAQHLRKGFEYAKQRCTAYPRYVVQRRLFPAFLETYLPVLRAVRFGHPLAVESARRPAAGARLRSGHPRHQGRRPRRITSTRPSGATASRSTGARSATAPSSTVRTRRPTSAPACVLQPPPSWSLHHAEPFGPLDSVVVVDTEAELLAAMNASNGSLVASIATDDLDFAERVAEQLQAFKVGINRAAQPRGPRGGLRRHGRLVEGCLRGRRPAGPGGHLRTAGARRAALRQLSPVLALPGALEPARCRHVSGHPCPAPGPRAPTGSAASLRRRSLDGARSKGDRRAGTSRWRGTSRHGYEGASGTIVLGRSHRARGRNARRAPSRSRRCAPHTHSMTSSETTKADLTEVARAASPSLSATSCPAPTPCRTSRAARIRDAVDVDMAPVHRAQHRSEDRHTHGGAYLATRHDEAGPDAGALGRERAEGGVHGGREGYAETEPGDDEPQARPWVRTVG